MRDAALPVMGVVVLLLPLDMFLVAVPVFDKRCLESLVGDQAGGWFEPSFMCLEPSP